MSMLLQNGILGDAFMNFLTNTDDIVHNCYTKHLRNIHQFSMNVTLGVLKYLKLLFFSVYHIFRYNAIHSLGDVPGH